MALMSSSDIFRLTEERVLSMRGFLMAKEESERRYGPASVRWFYWLCSQLKCHKTVRNHLKEMGIAPQKNLVKFLEVCQDYQDDLVPYNFLLEKLELSNFKNSWMRAILDGPFTLPQKKRAIKMAMPDWAYYLVPKKEQDLLLDGREFNEKLLSHGLGFQNPPKEPLVFLNRFNGRKYQPSDLFTEKSTFASFTQHLQTLTPPQEAIKAYSTALFSNDGENRLLSLTKVDVYKNDEGLVIKHSESGPNKKLSLEYVEKTLRPLAGVRSLAEMELFALACSELNDPLIMLAIAKEALRTKEITGDQLLSCLLLCADHSLAFGRLLEKAVKDSPEPHTLAKVKECYINLYPESVPLAWAKEALTQLKAGSQKRATLRQRLLASSNTSHKAMGLFL